MAQKLNLKKKILFIFREMGRERKRERNIMCERYIEWSPLTSNWRRYGSPAGAQSTEPQQPGPFLF